MKAAPCLFYLCFLIASAAAEEPSADAGMPSATAEVDALASEMDARFAEVKEAIPPDRLLVFEPSDGWETLCPFLGVAIPETPYPFTNTTEDFRAAMQTQPASSGATAKTGEVSHD